jgi:RNA polymerase sigma-70 factor (ECF subfamily)
MSAVVLEFERFYAVAWAGLLRPLVLVTADRGEAEDVLQEAFIKASRDWARVSQLQDPAAWVRRVAINAAIDGHRRRRRQHAIYRRAAERQVLPTEAVSLEVVDALRSLPIAERQVLVCHYLLSMPVAEIGDELGRPSGTVKAQLVRGRARLAELLRLDFEVETS